MTPSALAAAKAAELLEGEGWYGLHDVIVEALGTQPTKEQATALFHKLPAALQNYAYEWGTSDTVFRETSAQYITDNNLTLD